MRLQLEQLFYGRGPSGYGILGMTPGAATLADKVAALCETIGAPDDFARFKPFLVSRPVGDRVAMVCVGRGAPDSGGRETVFCHALVGLASELSEAHLDAFVLQERGLFRSEMPLNPEALEVESANAEAPLPAPFSVRFPAALLSDKPEPQLVRALLGTAALGRAWTTYAYRPLPKFDLYVLHNRAVRPQDAACYDVRGNLVSGAPSAHSASSVRAATQTGKVDPMFKVSIFLNAILLVLCAFLLIRPGVKPAVPAENPSQNGSAEIARYEKTITEKDAQIQTLQDALFGIRKEMKENTDRTAGLVSREMVVQDLRVKFTGERIESFQLLFDKEPWMKAAKRNNSASFNELCQKVNPYILFVNQYLLDAGENENQEEHP